MTKWSMDDVSLPIDMGKETFRHGRRALLQWGKQTHYRPAKGSFISFTNESIH